MPTDQSRLPNHLDLVLQANKKQVRSELEAVNNGRDALREQVRSMKGKMEYTSVEKIDEAIARMEGRLQHSSMPLAEEKRVLEDIKKLRASRVRAYHRRIRMGHHGPRVPMTHRNLLLVYRVRCRQMFAARR